MLAVTARHAGELLLVTVLRRDMTTVRAPALVYLGFTATTLLPRSIPIDLPVKRKLRFRPPAQNSVTSK